MSDELRTLVDRSEIIQLVDRLGRWLDERRWDEAPSLFTADATAETPGGVARGRAALVEQARRNHDGHPTQHVTRTASWSSTGTAPPSTRTSS